MASNRIGQILQLTTFGESHGPAIGGVLDGFPAGIKISPEGIQHEMDRRKPGQSKLTTQRKEQDKPEFLSGLFEGQTTGMPIAWTIRNRDAKAKDYTHLKDKYRPAHADYTYEAKFGIRDYRGGGRSSARETANWVVAGALCKQYLQASGVKIHAFVSQIGTVKLNKPVASLNFDETENSVVRCPDRSVSGKMESLIKKVRKEGDTLGGVVTGFVENVPIGLGDPVFEKLHANLGKLLFSINAVKGVEFGSGFLAASMRGTEHNDAFTSKEGTIETETNYSGGIQGGISNGMPVEFRVAFKPVATLMRDQRSVDASGKPVTVKGRGRHDPCVVPRAVPIVEAVTALVLTDHYLLNKINRKEA